MISLQEHLAETATGNANPSVWKNQLTEELFNIRKNFLSRDIEHRPTKDVIMEQMSAVHSVPSDATWEQFSEILLALDSSIVDGVIDSAARSAAREAFSSLQKVTEARKTPDLTSGDAIGDFVLASYGVFLIAAIEGDDQTAAITLFKTTEKHPVAATQIFPASLYGGNYQDVLKRGFRELERLVKNYTNLRNGNLVKRIKSVPTRIVELFIVVPISYFAAVFGGLSHESYMSSSRSHRVPKYTRRVKKLYSSHIQNFEAAAKRSGWLISRTEDQKEEMMKSQVFRIKSIFRNHCLTATQEAKIRRRELEFKVKVS